MHRAAGGSGDCNGSKENDEAVGERRARTPARQKINKYRALYRQAIIRQSDVRLAQLSPWLSSAGSMPWKRSRSMAMRSPSLSFSKIWANLAPQVISSSV